MRKVSFVTTDITQPAGTERVIINLSNYFSSHGVLVELHSLSTSGGTAFYELDDRIKIIHHGLSDYSTENNFFIKAFRKLTNTLRVKSCLKSINGDFIIGTGKHINTYLAVFKKSKQHKIIGCEHFAYNAPMSRFTKAIRNYFYKKLDYLVVLTEKDREFYSRFVSNVYCIPNSYSFYPENSSSLDNKIVLAIGRHTPQKGYDLLLPVWKEVAAEYPDWTLHIIGTGPLLKERESQAASLNLKETVKFLPPAKDIVNRYLESSVFVMPSRYEAFPMVLLEAEACGLPCVAYDCDTGPGEIIRHGEDGFLVPVGDANQFKEQLTKLISNATLRNEMAKAARQNVKRFGIDEIGGLWEKLFNENIDR